MSKKFTRPDELAKTLSDSLSDFGQKASSFIFKKTADEFVKDFKTRSISATNSWRKTGKAQAAIVAETKEEKGAYIIDFGFDTSKAHGSAGVIKARGMNGGKQSISPKNGKAYSRSMPARRKHSATFKEFDIANNKKIITELVKKNIDEFTKKNSV